MKYDAIVVGTGTGGLSAAVMLAKEGMRVLALEQHTTIGGTLQCFKRKGEMLPTGVHYIGSLGRGQVLRRYFDYKGILDRVSFVELDPEGFDEYHFPGMTFRVPKGVERFRAHLLEAFPAERPAIDRFLADMTASCARFDLYHLRAPSLDLGERIDTRSLGAYLEELTADVRLRAVLSACNVLYGIPPADCPLFIHFLLLDSYLQSAWRVEGGSHRLAEAMASRLLELGGEIRKKSKVVSIEVRDGAVAGVTLKKGERLEADRVIFSGHVKALFPMLPPDALRSAYRERLVATKESLSFFGVHLLQRENAAPAPERNLYLFDSWDPAEFYERRLIEPDRLPTAIYCSRHRNPENGVTTVNLLAPMGYEEVRPWHETRLGWRDPSYKAMKLEVAGRMVEFVRARMPGAVEGGEIVSTFTPLTVRDFLGAPEGSAYGIMKGRSQLREATVGSKTRVKGLYLAGQNVVLPGVVGTVIGSVATCCHILGANHLIDRVNRET